ncbi:MAG: glutamate racemase [Chlamydiales bacterium]|jgi:glutamate racemase|nr:glutamate racemase [Chlamydiales bacterium]
MDSRPIGIFDSGVGGLTVFKAIQALLPHESLVYFGDTARAPYGPKAEPTVVRYSLENARFLSQFDIKLLVIACNTASAFASKAVRSQVAMPVVEVISAGVSAVLEKASCRAGLVGTKGTIASGLYQKKLLAAAPKLHLFAKACPMLVPLIEERLFSHAATELFLKEYVAPLKELGIDTLLLACTHYPLLLPLFQRELGPSVSIIDSAEATASLVQKTLRQLSLQAPPSSPSSPFYRFYASDDPGHFSDLASLFLQQTVTCYAADDLSP